MKSWITAFGYLVLAPLLGGLLSGIERKIAARMQSRVGPPVWQPFLDVFKLFEKENLVVRRSQNLYITFFLILIIFTGGLFFAGEDILLVIFAFTLSGVFLVLGGYKASSPYSFIGSERELLLMVACEPMFILTSVGMYMVTKSFYVIDIVTFNKPLFYYLPGIFIGFIFILVMEFRESPFDLATSYHAHQELVKGITTEFSGKTLAIIEIAHWYETIFFLGFIYLFFAFKPVLGLGMAGLFYFLIILIDNTFARIKWQLAVKSAWQVSSVFGMVNIIVLFIISR